MRRVIAFDVNETLLDLRALDGLFGGAEARERWFAQAAAARVRGADHGARGRLPGRARAALEMLGDGPTAEELGAAMRRLPLHADVAPALDRLREGGLTLCALTNSPLEGVTEALEHAGIADRFEAILSAEQVGRLKPAPEPYRLAAEHVRRRDGRRDARRLPRLGLRGRAGRGLRGGVRAPPRDGARVRRRDSRRSWATTSARSPPSFSPR